MWRPKRAWRLRRSTNSTRTRTRRGAASARPEKGAARQGQRALLLPGQEPLGQQLMGPKGRPHGGPEKLCQLPQADKTILA